MDRLRAMEAFVTVARLEGFAPAARKLGVSAPVMTKAVSQLEKELGVRLLERTTRSVTLTEAGSRYLAQATDLLEQFQSLNDSITRCASSPAGHLAITAPVLFGQRYVMPVITAFLGEYPETDVTAVFLDRRVNLVEEGIDVAVRIGELPDSSLQARQVGEVRHLVCAAPEYIAKHGSPSEPKALKSHSLISTESGDFSPAWSFSTATTVRLRPRLRTTTNEAAIVAAKSGLGITRVLSYQIADELDSGELIPLLADYQPDPLPVSLIHRQGRYEVSRIRLFVDRLAGALEKALR